MANTAVERVLFECGECGRTLRWTPTIAGRRGRCTCGAMVQCPRTPPVSRQPGQDRKRTSASAAPTLAYHARPEPASAAADPEQIRNLYMPLWLLGGGVVIEVVASFIRFEDTQEALTHVAIQIILGTVLMLAGMLVAARVRGIHLGHFWTAVLKLSAISIAPAALVSLATPLLIIVPFGELIGWIGSFVLYFALLGALFDLDQEDTWYCVMVIFLIKVAAFFGLMWAMPQMSN